ncbi:MAG: ferrous iron transporter B [Firmicutes bacterium]|nr:ferrous iron transporter B [Bacillota bacterium]
MSRIYISHSQKAGKDRLEIAVHEIAIQLKGDYRLSPRAIALLLLSGDTDTHALVMRHENRRDYMSICRIIDATEKCYELPLSYVIGLNRQSRAHMIADRTARSSPRRQNTFFRILDYITIWPVTGIPILLLVLYYGLYKFVGGFGAGTAVNFLELRVFRDFVNPLAASVVNKCIGSASLRELIVGEYGIITLGLRYAIAMVLPIVGTFFIVFSVLEDTGYLPRLSLLADRALKIVGLTGRAVIPLSLGLGCDTMATLVTRTLESHREKVITTFLLALAVPCSGQLGVIVGMLSQRPLALTIWVMSISAVFMLSGIAAKKLIPGERAVFVTEVPPLRMPVISNVLTKTMVRMKWYFAEIIPVFIATSILVWAGRITGILNMVISYLRIPVLILGLPEEAAFAFLFGFLRRDYGAAGLYDLFRLGRLNGVQLVVACVVLTLFVPCVAQFAIMWKERGGLAAVVIAACTMVIAFITGAALNISLTWLGLMP